MTISQIFEVKTKLCPNFRHAGKGKSGYLAATYRKFLEGCITEFRQVWGCNSSLTCAVSVEVAIPSSYRGDLVNYYKGIEDCLVKAGVLEDDNSRIVTHITIRQNFNKTNSTLITVLW